MARSILASHLLLVGITGCAHEPKYSRRSEVAPIGGKWTIESKTKSRNICAKVDQPEVDVFGLRERGDVVTSRRIDGPQVAIMGDPGKVELRVHWSRLGSVELPLRETTTALFALDSGKVVVLNQVGDSPAVVYLEGGVFRTRWLTSYSLETSALAMLAEDRVIGLRTHIANLVIHHDFETDAGTRLRALARCFAPPPKGTESAGRGL